LLYSGGRRKSHCRKGSHLSKKGLNALILLNCNVGETQKHKTGNEDISRILQISMKKTNRVKKSFVEEGLSIALEG
jgi:hypothetical protein